MKVIMRQYKLRFKEVKVVLSFKALYKVFVPSILLPLKSNDVKLELFPESIRYLNPPSLIEL